ncbi:MAG: 6-phosphogluconolactonase [Chloroflexota bacterium]
MSTTPNVSNNNSTNSNHNLSVISEKSTGIAGVEQALSALWSQLAEADGKNAVLRATTLNLVLHSTDDASALAALISEVTQGHPCRAIVIEGDDQADMLEAIPSVFCRPTLGTVETRMQVCCEEILIKAGVDATDRVPAAVQSLLLSDLPVYLFCQGELLPDDSLVKALGEVVDGLVVDSATFDSGSTALHNLEALMAAPHIHANLFDLNWQRLTPWRRALAQAFDRAEDRAALHTIHEVEIVHSGARTQGLLFIGWLISRLGWWLMPSDTAADTWTAKADQSSVALRLRAESKGTPGLQQVTLTADQKAYTISLSDKGDYIVPADGPHRAVSVPSGSAGTLLSSVMDLTGHDQVFEDALTVASMLSPKVITPSVRATIVLANDGVALAQQAAQHFVDTARAAIAQHGRFAVALSGGSTPKALYQLLAEPPYRDQVAWANVHVFWGDERDVPVDNPESNQLMARETLLSKVPIPPENIHGLLTGQLSAREAAARYAGELRAFFQLEKGQLPTFDLILLGMGDDGHTASLFPHTEALTADDSTLVVANPVPQHNTTRITLTAGVINNASSVVFLVSGKAKAEMLYAVFKGPLLPDNLPSQRIHPVNGTLLVMADRAAAAMLESDK